MSADGLFVWCRPASAKLTSRACGCRRRKAHGALMDIAAGTKLASVSDIELSCLMDCSVCEYTQHWGSLWRVFQEAIRSELIALVDQLDSIDWDKYDPEVQQTIKRARYKRQWQSRKRRRQAVIAAKKQQMQAELQDMMDMEAVDHGKE